MSHADALGAAIFGHGRYLRGLMPMHTDRRQAVPRCSPIQPPRAQPRIYSSAAYYFVLPSPRSRAFAADDVGRRLILGCLAAAHFHFAIGQNFLMLPCLYFNLIRARADERRRVVTALMPIFPAG